MSHFTQRKIKVMFYTQRGFTNVLNPRAFIERKDEFLETFIGDCASIGANATILCGITIGSFSLIAAGAVVTKSVPNYGLVLGNPAKLAVG